MWLYDGPMTTGLCTCMHFTAHEHFVANTTLEILYSVYYRSKPLYPSNLQANPHLAMPRQVAPPPSGEFSVVLTKPFNGTIVPKFNES